MAEQQTIITSVACYPGGVAVSESSNTHSLSFYDSSYHLIKTISDLPYKINALHSAQDKICASGGPSAFIFSISAQSIVAQLPTDKSELRMQNCGKLNKSAKMAACGCEDSNIYIIHTNLASPTIKNEIKFHTKPVIDLVFFSEQLIASISEDKMIAIIDVVKGECIDVLNIKVDTILKPFCICSTANGFMSISRSHPEISYITQWKACSSNKIEPVNTYKVNSRIVDAKANEKYFVLYKSSGVIQVTDYSYNTIRMDKTSKNLKYDISDDVVYMGQQEGSKSTIRVKRDCLRIASYVAGKIIFLLLLALGFYITKISE